MILNLFKKWRVFLKEGNLADYNRNGTAVLYHYSTADSDTISLDPDYFLSHRNSPLNRSLKDL